jgi:histone H3/H4
MKWFQKIKRKMTKNLLVKTNVKEASEFSVSEEFIEELEKKVSEDIKKAEERARANNRRTLLARDV